LERNIVITKSLSSQNIKVEVTANREHMAGIISYFTEPYSSINLTSIQQFELKSMDSIATFEFNIDSNEKASELKIYLSANARHEGGTVIVPFNPQLSGVQYELPLDYNKSISFINYDHIPTQIILEPAVVKLVKLDIQIPQLKIAYIEGAGDKVDESIEQLGLGVTKIKLNFNFDALSVSLPGCIHAIK
jgi:hypothetical protein